MSESGDAVAQRELLQQELADPPVEGALLLDYVLGDESGARRAVWLLPERAVLLRPLPGATVGDRPGAGTIRVSETPENLEFSGVPGRQHDERLQGNVLIVADLHLGKSEAFQRRGIAVPQVHVETDLERLSALSRRSRASELIILGDMFHEGSASRDDIQSPLHSHRDHLPERITLVQGNHDRCDLSWLEALNIQVQDTPVEKFGLTLAHNPGDIPSEPRGITGVCGHIHPIFTLADAGDRIRLPCFTIHNCVLTLPAFGSFTGGQRQTAERVFPVTETEVFEV